MSIPSAPTQEANNTATTGATTCALTISAISAGNTFFVEYFAPAGEQTVSSITGTNCTFTRQQQSAATNHIIDLWMGVVAGGSTGTSITLNFSGALSGTINAHGSEWTGSYTLDAHNNVAVTTSTNPSTGTITPTSGQNQLLIGAARRGGTFSSGPTNSFTAFTTGNAQRVAAYLVVASTTGTYSTDWTFTTSLAWEAIYATFSQAGAGGTNWGPMLGQQLNRLVQG